MMGSKKEAIRKIIRSPDFPDDMYAMRRTRKKVDRLFDSNPDLDEQGVFRVMQRLRRGDWTLDDAVIIYRHKKGSN